MIDCAKSTAIKFSVKVEVNVSITIDIAVQAAWTLQIDSLLRKNPTLMCKKVGTLGPFKDTR